MVSSSADLQGIWFEGLRGEGPAKAAIVVPHGMEAPAEVASHSNGVTPRARDLARAAASSMPVGTAAPGSSTALPIHLLNCVFII